MKKYVFLFALLFLPMTAQLVSCGSGTTPAGLVNTYSATSTPTSTPTPSVKLLATTPPTANGLTLDNNGNLYVALNTGNAIEEITSAGVTSTLLTIGQPNDVAYSGSNWFMTTLEPTPYVTEFSGGVTTNFPYYPASESGVAVNSTGTTIAAAYSNTSSGIAFYVFSAGTWVSRGAWYANPGTSLAAGPQALAFDNSGDLFVALSSPSIVIEYLPGINPNPVTIAGLTGAGFANGPAATAQFNTLAGIAVDSRGDIYVTDSGNNAIREISGGQVTTLVGTTLQNALVTTTSLSSPQGIAVSPSGNVYFTGNSTSIYEYIP